MTLYPSPGRGVVFVPNVPQIRKKRLRQRIPSFIKQVGGVAMAIHRLPKVSTLDEQGGVAALIDVETTGLNRVQDEVVELAIVLFAYERRTGRIQGVIDQYSGLRDPGRPIPKEATQVHGIHDRDVQGKRLDDRRVQQLLDQADFFVAHNASFDRAFVERLYPQVKGKYWACSMRGVPWKEQGFSSRALQNLLRAHDIEPGTAHRGADDALATLNLLARTDATGTFYFKYLVDRFAAQDAEPASAGTTSTHNRRKTEASTEPKPSRSFASLPIRILKAPFLLVTWPLRKMRRKHGAPKAGKVKKG